VTLEIKKPLQLIVLALLIFVLVREITVVNVKTPINFGDEGFHTRLAQWIYEEKEIPRYIEFEATDLEKGSYARPPLWNTLEAGFFMIFGVNELVPEILTPFVSFMLGLATFVLVKKIFDQETSFFATIMIITAPAIVTYSVLFYTDVLFTLFLTLFFLTLIMAIDKKDKKYWLLSGIFASLSILTKLPGLVIFPMFGILFLYQLISEKKNFEFKNYLLVGLVVLLLTSTFFLRNLIIYHDPLCRFNFIDFGDKRCKIDNFENQYEFQKRTADQGTEVDIFSFGIGNYLMFAYGNIWLIVFGFITGLLILFSEKNKNVKFAMFLIFLVLVTIIFPTSTGRSEDTSRYTLGWLPIICVISGLYFSKMYNFIKPYQKYIAFVVFAFVLVSAYNNFNDKLVMMVSVKNFSPSFFEACDFVKVNLPEDVRLMSVWSHRVVFSCQRNAAGNIPDITLSRDLDYTLDVAKQQGITHIFLQKFSLSNEELSERYPISFVQFLEENPQNFVKIYENGPTLEQCLSQGLCDGNIIYEIRY
jgi:4-amino-4-deoxy-L-arabinose transferase-like glycosyltransferase